MSDFDWDLQDDFNWDSDLFEPKEKQKIIFDKRQSDISKNLDFFNYSEVFKLEEKFQMIKDIDFTIPKTNEQIHFMTAKRFNLFDILDFIIFKSGEPDYLLISFFTANKEMIYRANEYSKKYNCEICLSDILNTKRYQEVELKNLMEFKFFFANNHAKIILCKIKDNYFILSGSLNSGNNARIEQLILSNNKSIFDFYKENFLYVKENFGKKRNDIF